MTAVNPPPRTAVVLLSTNHEERVVTDFDCLLFFKKEPAGWKPRFRQRGKVLPGIARLREFFSPLP